MATNFNFSKLRPKACGPACQLIALIVIAFISGTLIISLQLHAPAYPVGYYTFGWVLSLFFPFVAICFILYSLRVRLDEIIDHFAREKLWQVYASTGEHTSEENIKCFLWERLDEYYNLFELAIFSLLTAVFTVLIYILIAAQFTVPLTPCDGHLIPKLNLQGDDWAVITGSGFLGALSGSMVFVLRRYRMYDLRPVVFLQATVALIAGTFSGAFVTMLYPDSRLGTLAFIIGFLSAINIDFLPNLMRAHFAKLTGMPLPNSIPSDLTEIISNAEVIESLNTISIYSIRELASIDPIRLYLNMPQQIEIINTVVDQALLHFYFPEYIKDLEQANIQRFTQLLPAVGCQMTCNGFIWPKQISFLDNGGRKDAMLLSAVKGIVEGRQHHRILGLIIEEYRKTFFPWELTNTNSDIQRSR